MNLTPTLCQTQSTNFFLILQAKQSQKCEKNWETVFDRALPFNSFGFNILFKPLQDSNLHVLKHRQEWLQIFEPFGKDHHNLDPLINRTLQERLRQSAFEGHFYVDNVQLWEHTAYNSWTKDMLNNSKVGQCFEVTLKIQPINFRNLKTESLKPECHFKAFNSQILSIHVLSFCVLFQMTEAH